MDAVGESATFAPRTAGAVNGEGRKPKWKTDKTTAIRVPEKFAADLIAIAQEWDRESP